MERLQTSHIAQFMKRFRFRNGTLRGIRLKNRSKNEQEATIDLVVVEVSKNKKIRLRLKFHGVDEYRFQRRPAGGLVRLTEVHLGSFDGLLYFDLDAYSEPAPQVMDFRASDAFIAAREMSFEVVEKSKPSS